MRDEQQDHLEQLRGLRFSPYVNERHCSNCNMYGLCWTPGTEVYFPGNFIEREGWPLPRVSDYMKRIYGGICNNFVMNRINVDLNKMDIDKQWDK